MKLRKDILLSSADPTKISATIKGIGITLIPVILLLLKATGLDVLENDLVDLVNQVAILAGTAVAVYGLVRKLVNYVKR